MTCDEGIKLQTLRYGIGVLLYDWSGYVNEIEDAIDTSLVGLSSLMTFLATLCFV
jgi:hypothetical protein